MKKLMAILFILLFIISICIAEEYTFTPPYTMSNPTIQQYQHNEYSLGAKGNYHALTDCTGDLNTGVIRHNIVCSSNSFILESYVNKCVKDFMSRNFTVPYDGQWEITFNGSISADYYEVASALLGAGKGKLRFWLNGGHNLNVKTQQILYETDLSFSAFLEEASLEALWKTASILNSGAGLAKYFLDISAFAIPEASWPPQPTTFSIKYETALLTNTSYHWDFWVNSDLTSHAVLFISLQHSALESYITLDSVNIKYLGEIPPNEPPVLYNYGFIADPAGPDLYPHTELEFYVYYDDPEDYSPAAIAVRIDGVLYPMRQDAGDRYKLDTRIEGVGQHSYSFYAVDKQGASVETPAQSLTIKAFDPGTFEFLDYVIDDSQDMYASNNNDKFIQSGEVVSIRPRLKYDDDASETVTNIDVTLTSNDPGVEEVYSPENYPDMSPGDDSYPDVGEYFKVKVERSCSGAFYLDADVEWRGQNGETQNAYIEDALLLDIQPEGWINITPDEYDFGAVKPIPENDVVLTLNIQNIGTEILNISDIQTSHGDTEVSPTVFSVNPGQSSDVIVTIHVSTLDGQITRDVFVIHGGRAKRDTDEHFIITGLVSETPTIYEVPTVDNAGHDPDISGSKIVFEDDIDSDGNDDIMLYDVLTGQLSQIAYSQYIQFNPKVDGNLVVWEDGRHWDETGSVNDQMAVYGYDISTDTEFPIMTDPADVIIFGVSGNRIAIAKLYEYILPYTGATYTYEVYNLIVYEYQGNGQCTQIYTTGWTPGSGTQKRPSVKESSGDSDFNENMLVYEQKEVYWDAAKNRFYEDQHAGIYKIDYASGESSPTLLPCPTSVYRLAAGPHSFVYTSSVSGEYLVYKWPGCTQVTPDGDDYGYASLAFNGNDAIYSKEIYEGGWQDYLFYWDLNEEREYLINNNPRYHKHAKIDEDGLVWDYTDNSNIRHVLFTFLNQSDISVSPSNISFSNDNPIEGTTIDISVMIQNSTDYDVTSDITAKLFDGDPDSTGIQLGTDYVISGGMTAQSEASHTFTSIPVGIEGEHEIYAQVLVDVFDVYANNKASKILNVVDAHTTSPKISNVWVSEYNGDGDSIPESDEEIIILWQAAPMTSLGIADTYCQIADVNYIPDEGQQYVTVGPFTEGEYTFTIFAEDNDVSPETATYEGNFSVAVASIDGDLNNDGIVNFEDYAKVVIHWSDDFCSNGTLWCEGADIDLSGHVDLKDLSMVAEHWLEGFVQLDSNLVAYWSFDNPNDPGHDDSGNEYDGTVYGAEPTNGIYGNALSFDGLNDYVGTSLTPSIYATASIWIHPEADATGGFLGTGYTTDSGKDGWSWSYIGSGYHSVAIDFWKGNARISDGIDTPSGSIPLNQWSLITVVVNDTDISVYVNGEISTTGTILSSPSVHDRGLMIGRNFQFGGGASTMKGKIDEVRIYNQVLSDYEIQYLYQNP